MKNEVCWVSMQPYRCKFFTAPGLRDILLRMYIPTSPEHEGSGKGEGGIGFYGHVNDTGRPNSIKRASGRASCFLSIFYISVRWR